jgi:hypothetical protein
VDLDYFGRVGVVGFKKGEFCSCYLASVKDIEYVG